MKYLLIVTLAFWCATYFAYEAAARPGDDFGAGILAWLCIFVSAVLTFSYVGLAAWRHSLL